MLFIMRFICFIKRLIRLPVFMFWHTIDKFHSRKEKWHLRFEGWGLHIFCGSFGSGKTSTAVYKAYRICKQYPQVMLLTNIKVSNFPSHTKIEYLTNVNQILNAPNNTLVLIDEIGTIFNSRDFISGKGKAVPKILFQHLCQCRHRRMMIFGTCQRWNFLDKALRDITATVYSCRTQYRHPFSRLNYAYVYDAQEYDMAVNNPMIPLIPIGSFVFIQSDRVRNMYDTMEMVDGMLQADYLSDNEIMANRAGICTNIFATEAKDLKQVTKNISDR